MARITFQKRQKEMKRLEKQRMKAERRAQRKLAKGTESQAVEQNEGAVAESEPQEADHELNPS
jgi:hypothetical protein